MFIKNLANSFAAVFIGVSLMVSSYFVAGAIKQINFMEKQNLVSNDKVFNLSQTAKYLNMTEEELRAIINTENKVLETTGSFSGKMFPYFTINNKDYFYKDEIDEWLKEVSNTRRGYNTYKGFVVQ